MSGSSSAFAWSPRPRTSRCFERSVPNSGEGRSRDGPPGSGARANAGGAGRALGRPVRGAAWRARGPQIRRSRRYRRASRRRTGRRNRFLRQCAAHRRCDCDPRHQRAGADARRLSRSWPKHTPAIVEAVLAALALRFARETARLTPIRASPTARTVALIQGGYEAVPEAFDRRLRDRACGDRCRDRRSRPSRDHVSRPGAGFARSHRLAQQDRADRAAGGLSRRRAKIRSGPARPFARPTWSCSSRMARRPRRRADGGRDLRLQDSSGFGAPPGSHSRRGAAARSAAPRPGSPACRAS